MTTIAEYLEKASQVNLEELVEESIIENSEAVITLNQLQLFNDSEDQEGEKILTYNSILYAIWKNKGNPGPGLMHPDLYDTGDFYRAFFVKAEKGQFEIDSTDWKSPKLKQKYGSKIFGLNKDHLAQLTKDYIRGSLIEKILIKLS